MKSLTKLLLGTTIALGTTSCDYDSDTRQYDQEIKLNNDLVDALAQRENISILENAIEEDLAILSALPPSFNTLGNDEEEIIAHFNQEIKPLQEDFLGIDHFENPDIITGIWSGFLERLDFYGGLSLSTYLIMGLLGIGSGLAGLGLGFELGKKIKEGKSTLLHKVLLVPTSIALAASSYLAYVGCDNICLTLENASNNYSSVEDTIALSYTSNVETGEDLAIILTHEMTHYLQDYYNSVESSILHEGHARGVEVQIAEELFETTENPAYYEAALGRELRDLVTAYYFLCDHFGVVPETFEEIGQHSIVEQHSLGTAIFRIREEQWGEEIYPLFLEGNYKIILFSPERLGITTN